jgi:Na+-translocating ferredoxin:NAD+ oxidoreductase RnfG subunit
LCLAFAATAAHGAVYRTQDEALHDAFPDADRIDAKVFVLDDAQASHVRELSETDLDRRIWTVHTAHRAEELQGYALLDVRTVRTFPEALLIVLTPDGALRSVRVLAFHEPTEYQPSERWLAQLGGKRLGPDLRLKRDIQGIAGATLSSQSVVRAVRTALALYQVVIHDQNPAE